MITNEKKIGDTRVVWVAGPNLDAAAVAVLRAEFLPTVELERPLLLCVEQVEFADSIGMSFFRRLRSVAGDDNFALAGVNDRLTYCFNRFPSAAWPNTYESLEAAQSARDETGSLRVPAAREDTAGMTARAMEDVSNTSEDSWEHQTT